MNFAEIMNSIGAESMGYEAPINEIDEMNAEIALESELDKNFAEMDAMNTVATISEIEAVSIALSERELALESTDRTAEEVYRDFGLESVVALEAIKDVVARKYYGGVSNIKALINKCISWLKNLLGMGTSVKKVMTGLKKKADNQLKALRKLAGKKTEKLKRTMPKDKISFSHGDFEMWTSKDGQSKISGASMSSGDQLLADLKVFASSDGQGRDKSYAERVEWMNTQISAIKKLIEDQKDVYKDWKENDEEYEEGSAYSHIIDLLQSLKTVSDSNKANKVDTNIRKMIDALEKIRGKVNDEVTKDIAAAKKKNSNADTSDIPNLTTYFTKFITYLNLQSTLVKDKLKTYVRMADDILTHGKGIEAALV